ncbi:hypothetical protein LBMAG27_07760 [Bacteroidota bacterium]|nr:hypothetical protein LBMAG27_07760 [Bacteroidota bacterium]
MIYYEPFVYVGLIVFLGFYLIDKLYKKLPFNSLETYSLLILFGVPLLSMICSAIYWKQPPLYGFIAQKSWTFTIISFVIFYLLKTRKILLSDIRDVMLSIAWIQLVLYLITQLVLDPKPYADTIFAACSPAKGCTFLFDMMFFCFAILLYFFTFLRTNKTKYALYALIFFAYLFLVYQKRALTLSLVATAGLYFLFNTDLKKKLYYSTIIFGSIVILFGSIYLIRPDIIGKVEKMYGNVIDVLGGDSSGEASADSRIKQVITVGIFIAKNPSSIIFGNGRWYNNWDASPQFNYGRFYASDVGIIGALLVYGLIGIILVQFEYILTILWFRKIKINKKNLFLQTCRYYMLFYWIRSLPTGGSYFEPGLSVPFIFMAIIFFYHYIENKTDSEFEIPD